MIPVYLSRVHWIRLIDEKKSSAECFGLFYINMINYKDIACTDFANVSIALSHHSCKPLALRGVNGLGEKKIKKIISGGGRLSGTQE